MYQEPVLTADQSLAEEGSSCSVESFSKTLLRHGLELVRGHTSTLQVNVGLLCNQACRHCHLDAGPNRSEIMSRETVEEVAAYAARVKFEVVDITGGAPEMNPHLRHLIEAVAPLTSRVMLRANLTAMGLQNTDELIGLYKEHRVVIVGSLPALNTSQTDSQRGRGVLDQSLSMLKKLNDAGYGVEGSGLELNLVSNPTGAFLPPSQTTTEKKFRSDLARKWGIVFNNLFAFANVPAGRFLVWLKQSGNLDGYMQKLAASFNPCTIDGLMCRTLVSISWEGHLYDCDFNLAKGVPLGGRKRHVSQMEGLPEAGTQILAGDHCYACTAGSGFT
jgi:radical SAM/Cys-rich protein